MIQYVYPKKILLNTIKCDDAEQLLSAKPRQVFYHESRFTTFYGTGALLLDYGREICGGIRILTHIADKCLIKVRFGESASEAIADLGIKGRCNAHSFVETTQELLPYSDLPVGKTGFRFVYIEFLENAKVEIKSVFAENSIFVKKPLWEYSGTDAELKSIYCAAKRTIDLCIENGVIWDGVKRDRMVWAGDLYHELLAISSLYGKIGNIARSIEFLKTETPKGKYINDIPSYSVLWVLTVAEYYVRFNDEKFLRRQKKYIYEIFKSLSDNVNDKGEFSFEELFVDLNHFKMRELEEQGLRAISLFTCKTVLKIFKDLKWNADVILSFYGKLTKKAVLTFNDRSLIALKYLSTGDISEDERKELCNGEKSVSVFMSYFVFKSIILLKGKEFAAKKIKEYFGAMLSMGGDTLWENFDPSWVENSVKIDEIFQTGKKRDFHGDYGKVCFSGYRMSLCHGWGAYILDLLKDL